jgi:hypothetical protein
MNLFRSEEDIHNWARFDPAAEEGILSLPDLVKLFSGSLFRRRLDPDYISQGRQYLQEFLADLAELGKTRPFWQPGPH